jgi:hypothetical protein
MAFRSFGPIWLETEGVKKNLKLLDFRGELELCRICRKIAGPSYLGTSGTPALPKTCGSLSAIFSLCCVPNRLDYHPFSTHPVQHYIGSTADDQFPNAGLRSRVPQIRVISQGFDDRDDPNGQSFCRNGLVFCDVSADFLKPCTR